MLATIELDRQFGLMTIEINDKVSDDLLPKEPDWVVGKKVIPKVVFFARCLTAEFLG